MSLVYGALNDQGGLIRKIIGYGRVAYSLMLDPAVENGFLASETVASVRMPAVSQRQVELATA